MFRRIVVALAFAFVGCVRMAPPASLPVAGFEAATFTAADGGIVRYRLLRPRVVERDRRYPLVVIFHGSGAIGTDNVSQLGNLAKSWATPAMRECYPAFVLVPQFSGRSANYSGSGAAMTSRGTDELRNALSAIDSLTATLPIDRAQIVAIGFSMGGSAVWNALVQRPGLFAAAVSVAGVPNRDALPLLGRTRLLLVHGDADDENPFSAALAAFDAAPKNRVEFRRYEGLAHEFPAQLLARSDLARWLLGEHVCTTR